MVTFHMVTFSKYNLAPDSSIYMVNLDHFADHAGGIISRIALYVYNLMALLECGVVFITR